MATNALNGGRPVADAAYFNSLSKPATTPSSTDAASTAAGFKYQARGEATTFANDKYNVGQLVYPDDLMSESSQYGGNYAIFYINVPTDSKLLKDTTNFATIDDPSAIPPRQRGVVSTGAPGTGTIVGQQAVVGAAGGSVAKAVGVNVSKTQGGVIGAVTGAAVANQAASFTRAQKRLKQVIALYMPEDLQIKYSVDWTEVETAGSQALQTGIGIAGDMIGQFFGSGKKSGAGQAVNTALTTAALKGPTGDLTSAQTGLATNPKKEQVFKGVKYREFSLNFKFYPRSAAEADNIRQIIYAFKLHMHPEFKDQFNFLYIYPSEFDIYYYQNGKENMNIHRHTSVVLTDLDVQYTPNGYFTAFDDGMPTQINITMQFKELALLTKDNIMDGF